MRTNHTNERGAPPKLGTQYAVAFLKRLGRRQERVTKKASAGGYTIWKFESAWTLRALVEPGAFEIVSIEDNVGSVFDAEVTNAEILLENWKPNQQAKELLKIRDEAVEEAETA